ncbi:zinc transporter ZIP4 [Anarrhichthys ocellatus]|uniref:zinc transporter ZIP4 n=1 Tax=Anarrhichthys ocellatus TaxID=433405 RepID=UPI0012ED8C67|nr:zinc transporter ZIP4-like [Anarrhichthys ocellatus]
MFLSALLILASRGLFSSVSGSPAVEEAYRAVLSVVSPGQQYLNRESLGSVFNTLEKRVQCGEVSCEKCDLTDAFHQLISDHSTHEEDKTGRGRNSVTISVSQFPALAAGCVLYLSSPGLVCSAVRQGTWGQEVQHFLRKTTHQDHHEHEESEQHQDHEHVHIDVHELNVLLRELHDHYEPSDRESCVTAGDITTEVNASSPDQRQEVGAVLGRVLYHALQGHCFVSRALPEESFFLDYIMDHLGSTNVTVGDLEALMRSLHLGHQEDEHADHDHSGLRRRKRRSHEHQERHEGNATWDRFCASAEELGLIYGLADNSSVSSGLSRTDLARLSPALVQQILSGACADITEPLTPDELTNTEKYVYATIANVVITLTSMFGIVVLLCTSCTSVFQLCIQFCISLAVGSLTGDALLHLIPMLLGLHVHSDKTDSSNHSHGAHQEETPDYIYKMLVLIGGIYYFYLMETIFSLLAYKDNHHHHQHHHAEESEPHHCDHGRVLEMYEHERKQKDKSQSASSADLVVDQDNENSLSEPKELTREQRLLPYMITISDSIHNFADGLAMGAAFSLSWKSGLATSLAVLCHELPHELGDFAILLNSGVSVRKALLLNVGSAMTSFIGLYIALSVATDLATKQWIAAISAGLFLYVGLADMLPTMVHISNKKPWLMFLLQNVGLLTGWGILLLLSLYEERISF